MNSQSDELLFAVYFQAPLFMSRHFDHFVSKPKYVFQTISIMILITAKLLTGLPLEVLVYCSSGVCAHTSLSILAPMLEPKKSCDIASQEHVLTVCLAG